MLAVAHALETYKTISGDDVIAIVEGSPGPLVDGTPYADAKPMLEAYHEQALTVHEGRDKAMVLPLLARRPLRVDPDEIEVERSAMRPPDAPPSA